MAVSSVSEELEPLKKPKRKTPSPLGIHPRDYTISIVFVLAILCQLGVSIPKGIFALFGFGIPVAAGNTNCVNCTPNPSPTVTPIIYKFENDVTGELL